MSPRMSPFGARARGRGHSRVMTDDSTLTPDLSLRAFTEPRPDRATRVRGGPGGPDRDPAGCACAPGAAPGTGRPCPAARPGELPGARADPAAVRADGRLAVRVPARVGCRDGRRPVRRGAHDDPRPAVRGCPRRQLRDVRLPGPAAGVRPQRLRRDPARAVRVGRQAAGRQCGRRRAARRGQAQEDPGRDPGHRRLLPHHDRRAGPEEPHGGLVHPRRRRGPGQGAQGHQPGRRRQAGRALLGEGHRRRRGGQAHRGRRRPAPVPLRAPAARARRRGRA